MAHEMIAATNAVVVLDVALPGIVWGWIITMNMWAKSIGTGIIFIAFYLLKKYPENHIVVPRFNEDNGFYTTKQRSELMSKIK